LTIMVRMYTTKIKLALTCSYIGILSLLFITPSSFNSLALAQQTMSSSGLGNSGMDFGSMNFANNIFNSSSVFGTVGMSMVDGVKVTGVNVLQNNEVSVMLRHIMTKPGNTTLPGSVTVTAIRVPMNLRDLLSIASTAAAAASNKTANSGGDNNMNMMMGSMQGYGPAGGNPTSFMNNPLAFLKNIQIGSSNIVNANWMLPQSVTMGLVGMSSSNNKLSSPLSPQTADFIIVSVIPFTGKSIPAK
jgi:hypothetical protein